MALRTIISLLCLIFSVQLTAQSPGLQWQRMLGGDQTDWVRAITRTSDGNYVLAGVTQSHNGDVNCSYPFSDIAAMWVVKISPSGNLLWQRCLGGSEGEESRRIVATPDGGFLIGAQVRSTDGDISGNHGMVDIWLVKLDAGGNIQWQRCYGGSREEDMTGLAATSDGGYIFTGWTTSNDGDVTGAHANLSNMVGDGWVVKINSTGNIEWSKCIGGAYWDVVYSAIEMPGGGYMAVGNRQSTDGDFTGYDTVKDATVIKFNNTGQITNIQFYGGPGVEWGSAVVATADGNFLVGGQANMNGGDVSGVHVSGTARIPDVWVFKINPAGQLLWQKSYGGAYPEEDVSLVELPDGNFAFAASTGSSDGDVTGFHGTRPWVLDTWVVKASGTDGSILWQQAYGGATENEVPRDMLAVSDGSLMVVNYAKSYDGDIQWPKGDWDFWVIKVGPVNTIKGTVYIDANGNGIKDAGEKNYTGMVTSEKGSLTHTSTLKNGMFLHHVDTGSYTTRVLFPADYYTVNPVSFTSSHTNYANVDSVGFALVPIPGAKDLSLALTPLAPPNPGFEADVQIHYKNKGVEPTNATIRFARDARTNYVGASVPPTSIVNDTLIWQLSNLQPQDTGSIRVFLTVKTPPTVNVNDTLKHEGFIDPVNGDVRPLDNHVVLKLLVIGSFDPNDKQESHAGRIRYAEVLTQEYLNYVIRFQNTGTAGALNVVVRDTLDSKLDLESFEMISASHSFDLAIRNKQQLEWTFRNIYLPDSNTNEPASHGFISFRIKPKTTLVTGDVVQNSASIYFDYNLPVKTNTVVTEVINAAALPVRLTMFEGLLQNGVVNLRWKTAAEHNTKNFDIERSIDGVNFLKIGSVKAAGSVNGTGYAFTDMSPYAGYNYYRLKTNDEDGRYSHSNIVVISTKKSAQLTSVLYPNPSRDGILSININGKLNGVFRIDVLDASGRQVLSKNFGLVTAESYSTSLNLAALSKGLYVIRIVAGETIMSHKAIIK